MSQWVASNLESDAVRQSSFLVASAEPLNTAFYVSGRDE